MDFGRLGRLLHLYLVTRQWWMVFPIVSSYGVSVLSSLRLAVLGAGGGIDPAIHQRHALRLLAPK